MKIKFYLLRQLLTTGLFFLYLASMAQSNEHNDYYIFFLHNRFLETHDLDEAHPEYGRVEYKEILETFRSKDFHVITEKRNGNVNARDYALGVVYQIDSLITMGVAPEYITVIGTSKGGYIAQYVSTIARNPEINYVFVGAYRDSDIEEMPDIVFCGRILNIYENSDPYGVSAQARIDQSPCQIEHFKEIELETGLGHGFLFKALPYWTLPAIYWARGDYR